MWCRELQSPEVLLEHLQFVSASAEDDTIPSLSPAEEVIAAAVRRYFTLPGHPDCPLLRHLIPGEEFTRDAQDYGLRARLFILAITGSIAAPTEQNWTFTVSRSYDL